MKTIQQRHRFFQSFFCNICLFVFLASLLAACAGTADKETQPAEAGAASVGTTAAAAAPAESAAENADAADGGSAATPQEAPAAAEQVAATEAVQAQAAQTGESLPDITQPPGIVEECKKEDYVKQEQQARASIKKGKEATEAGRYGVGFKNADEHKKWSTMHNIVFSGVSKACAKLSECAKQHAKDKDKDKLCAEQAQSYADWKDTAKQFTTMVKSVETTQPPLLCSSPPALDDPPRCYQTLAEKISNTCDNETCQEASQCWRSISFLDLAINQAESACRFAHIKLSECRGYTEASGRRKAKFAQCNDMQTSTSVSIAPVL